MRLFQTFIVSISLILLLSSSAFAHVAGQPPFFKVNGKYANLYPVPASSLYEFNLPQDLPQDPKFLVNQPISFILDTSMLPVPPEVVKQSKFDWDFGDGQKGSGLSNSHTYNKIGSFILSINVDDGTTPQPQLLESALINVVPDLNYQLPNAAILVDGQQSSDPLTDILNVDFTKPVSLDGSKSTSASSITSYFWDFGDQTKGNGIVVTHTYKTDSNQVFAVLRITNSDGFFADQFVEFKSQVLGGQNPLSNQTAQGAATDSRVKGLKVNSSPSQLKFVVMGLIVALAVAVGIRILLRKKN